MDRELIVEGKMTSIEYKNPLKTRNFEFKLIFFLYIESFLQTRPEDVSKEFLKVFRSFLALNFCSLTHYKKLWYNCSLFVSTSFDPNYVTSRLMRSS